MKKFTKLFFYSIYSPFSYIRIILNALFFIYKEIRLMIFPGEIRKGDIVFDVYDKNIGIVVDKKGRICHVQFSKDSNGTFNELEIKKYK